jgi:hypothetical protein
MIKQIYSLLLVAFLVGIMSAAAPSAHAEFREEGTALIDRKGPNALVFDGHGFTGFVDRYMQVSSLTRFYDENGQAISLVDLKVPCQARILYRKKTSGENPEAISVYVEYYPENRPLDTKMSLPVMKPEPPQ